MQPELMLVLITVWLFVLWFGSIALEATGMERSRARFQAMSALTGTGFTTREAENIVGHPRRRLIVGWMMFLGSVGIILFLLILLVIIVVGIKPAKPTSAVTLVLSALPAVALMVLYWIGVLDKLATSNSQLAETHRIFQARAIEHGDNLPCWRIQPGPPDHRQGSAGGRLQNQRYQPGEGQHQGAGHRKRRQSIVLPGS